MPLDLNMGSVPDGYPLLDDGVYEARLTKAIFKPSKNDSANKVLHCTWEVETPSKTWSLMSFPTYTPDPNKNFTFKRFLQAITGNSWDEDGMTFDEEDVIGDSCFLLVGRELDNKNVMRNQIKDYYADAPEEAVVPEEAPF